MHAPLPGRNKKGKPKTLHVPNVPTPEAAQDRYDGRAEIWKAALAEFMRAVSHCGTGATGYAKWVLHDRYGGPDRIVYCCSREGVAGWNPRYEDCVPDHNERLAPPCLAYYTNRPGGDDSPGNFGFRWEVRFCWIADGDGPAEPQAPERLTEAAEKRRAKVVEKVQTAWAEDTAGSLFDNTPEDLPRE